MAYNNLSHLYFKYSTVCSLSKFYLWIKSSKGVLMGSKGKKGPRCVIFLMYKIFILFLLPSSQRRPTKANKGQQRPTKANKGQRRPMKAHSSQRRPTKDNAGPQKPTVANDGQQRPTKTKKGPNDARRVVWATGAHLKKFI